MYRGFTEAELIVDSSVKICKCTHRFVGEPTCANLSAMFISKCEAFLRPLEDDLVQLFGEMAYTQTQTLRATTQVVV